MRKRGSHGVLPVTEEATKMKPTLTQMIQSEQAEARRLRASLNGFDLSQTAPLWLAGGLPSHWQTIQIAKQVGIQRESVTVKRSTSLSGHSLYFVIMVCRDGNSTRAGASCSKERDIAIELAFRNAVRQLLVNESHTGRV